MELGISRTCDFDLKTSMIKNQRKKKFEDKSGSEVRSTNCIDNYLYGGM